MKLTFLSVRPQLLAKLQSPRVPVLEHLRLGLAQHELVGRHLVVAAAVAADAPRLDARLAEQLPAAVDVLEDGEHVLGALHHCRHQGRHADRREEPS